jgi:tetratricopeptide (TPR) repeat protein
VTELKTTSSSFWTPTQAFALAAFSLVLGLCGGWVIRRAFAASVPTQIVSSPAPVAAPSQPAPPNFGLGNEMPSPEQLKQAADSQAAPLLEQLKTSPTDAELLTKLGNIFYDAKQYPAAIDYYERALKSQPSDASVRTDLGTAYWYTGNAYTAIVQFQKALSYAPTKADTLFNLGIVKWQGKKDARGAIAAWQKLLDTNPGYENKDRVLQFIAQAKGS